MELRSAGGGGVWGGLGEVEVRAQGVVDAWGGGGAELRLGVRGVGWGGDDAEGL